MCEVCRRTQCASGCPNAPDPVPLHKCIECGSGIYAGDRYWEGPDGPVCESCMEDMSYETLLAIFGEEMKEAKEEENGW